AGAAQPGYDHQLFPRDFQIDVLEVVLSRALNVNRTVAPCWEREHFARSVRHFAWRLFCGAQRNLRVIIRINAVSGSRQNAANSGQHARAPNKASQKLSGVRLLNPRDLLRRSGRDDFTAAVTGFGAEIDDPIGRFDHLQIVFDHHEGMSAIYQALEQPQQYGNVVEVQSRGWLVEDEEIANCFAIRALGIGCWAFGVVGFSQMPDELQPL